MKERTGAGKIRSVITKGKGTTAGADGKPVDVDVEIKVGESRKEEEKKDEKKDGD